MSRGSPAAERVTAAGLRWRLRPGLRDRLLGPGGLRLNEWLRDGRARVVKHGPHCTVYRVGLPGLDFYLKHYRLGNVRARLRALLRPAKARLEYRRALAVAARGVPAVRPIGLGERAAGPGESFLATRSLAGVQPLGELLEAVAHGPDPATARKRQRLARDLGTFLARLHAAGVAHRDLHVGNILVRAEPSGRPRFYLVDLYDVRVGAPLSWRARRDNLTVFNRWFALRTSRTDRLRFWRAYCRAQEGQREKADGQRAEGPPFRPLWTQGLGLWTSYRERALEVEARTGESNRAFWVHRDKRCLHNNRHYRRVRSTAASGHAVRDLDGEALRTLLADPDQPFRRPDAVWLKGSPSSSVVEFDLTWAGQTRRVVYKRFRVVARTDPLTALVRPTPALRSWVSGHGLRERLLPTPRPLAVFHRRRFGLAYEGYLLAEKVADARDLVRWVDDLARRPAAEARGLLRAQIDAVARLVRDLHHRRLSHRDLKAANILVQGADDVGRLWLIDLVGVRRHRHLGRQRRARDVARLHASFLARPAVSRTDKLRFLRTYLQWGLRGGADWKGWWREVERATRAKVARNRRSGRPLS